VNRTIGSAGISGDRPREGKEYIARRRRLSVEQTVAVLKQAESGMPVSTLIFENVCSRKRTSRVEAPGGEAHRRPLQPRSSAAETNRQKKPMKSKRVKWRLARIMAKQKIIRQFANETPEPGGKLHGWLELDPKTCHNRAVIVSLEVLGYVALVTDYLQRNSLWFRR
jgi:hypothetical protein